MRTLFFLSMLIGWSTGIMSQDDYFTSISDHRFIYKKELADVIKNDTSFVRFFEIEPAYKVQGVFKALKNQPVFNMNTSSGKSKQAQKIGVIIFSLEGKKYQLSAYQLLALRTDPEHQDYFFIPFTDASSGEETYGAGRYLDFKLADIKNNSSLIIDFNKAYNPYCAFADGYNCPVPPAENQLVTAIRAGEKNYAKKWK
jgi:uncharacterized protein (DUF1684 family)